MRRKDPDLLLITSPMTVSIKDKVQIRELLLTAFKELHLIIGPSPAAELVCLNIDFFHLAGAKV